MPNFNNLDELNKYLQKNPETVLAENVGKIIEYKCPICNAVQKIEIITSGKGKCLNCKNEFEITLVIE